MDLKAADLNQFYGTERWYRHPLNRLITYTDGARYVAEHGEAYWLLDKIATCQYVPKIRNEEFQVWNLTVAKDHTAILACDDGNGNIVHMEVLSFTDFPLDTMKFYCENNVIMLPSER